MIADRLCRRLHRAQGHNDEISIKDRFTLPFFSMVSLPLYLAKHMRDHYLHTTSLGSPSQVLQIEKRLPLLLYFFPLTVWPSDVILTHGRGIYAMI